uniref:SUN domain-containing ossification factor n=1 Tax=Labrus bergylta TaxID=56723 RepID=A0A3Q3LUW4_9LABR
GEAELKDTKSDPESDPEPAASELDPHPIPHPDPQADVVLQPHTQNQNQNQDQAVPVSSTPEPVPAQIQESTDTPAAETVTETPAAAPSLDTPPSSDEAEHIPTSKSADPAHTGIHSLLRVCFTCAQVGDASVGPETDPSVPSKEDIPTFDEWKKQVMEVEKEKSQSLHTSPTGVPHPVKKVQKNFKNNYASVECGAKILSANNEAKSTSAILMENMDLYMLNPCSNKIWFVIELCEPIQVKQLDIANFELFSSTPRDFLVSISDRYPTNKWVKLGTFHARDERIVQSFPLDEQLYAKYVKVLFPSVKVELLSHFGSEHFCPLSLIRVFGTSMVEEYEEISDSQYPSERLEYLDEDYAVYKCTTNRYQDTSHVENPDLCTDSVFECNIFRDLKLINEYLCVSCRPDPAEQKHLESQEDSSVSSEPPPPQPSSLDSQEDRQIVTLVEEEEEEEEPRQSTVTLMEEEADRNMWESQTYCPFSSLSSLSLSCMATLPELLHRWCSARLARERLRSLKRRQLSVHTQTNTPALTHTPPLLPTPVPTPLKEAPPLSESTPEAEVPVQGRSEEPNTHSPDTHTPDLVILLEPSRTSSLPAHTLDPVPTPPLQSASIPETEPANIASPTLSVSAPPQPVATETPSPTLEVLTTLKEHPVQPLPTTEPPSDSMKADIGDPQRHLAHQTHGEQGDSLSQTGDPHRVEDSVEDELLSSNGNAHRTATDFYAELQNGGDYNGGGLIGNGVMLNGGTVHGSSQKESVFMRLNNRIKALEMNMSLSSRYLEELSQRYRKQMEEMQRAFNKTIIKLQNTSRIAEEQDQKQTDSIHILQSQLENVTKLMLNLTATVGQLQREVSDRQSYLVVSLVLCLFLGVLLCLQCCRNSSPKPITNTAALPKSNYYPSPKRCFSSYDDMSLKRRVASPLVRSKSFHLSSTDGKIGPDDLYIVEPLRFSPEKKQIPSLPPSETSSCSSSTHSEESYTSRLPPPSPSFPSAGLCNGHPLPLQQQTPLNKSRQEKRSMKRRKSRQTELQFPSVTGGRVESLPSLQQLMKGNKEINVGTIGVTAVTGHV